MRYDMCVWIYMCLPILFIISSSVLHDTPFHLIKNNKFVVRQKFPQKFLKRFFFFFLISLNFLFLNFICFINSYGSSQEAEQSMMFYRGVKVLEGNTQIEFESLKQFVKFFATEEKVSVSDFRKFQLTKLLITKL